MLAIIICYANLSYITKRNNPGKRSIMKVTTRAKKEIKAMAQGNSLYAMNAPHMAGYAYDLDKEGNLWSGMFVDSKSDLTEKRRTKHPFLNLF